MSRPKTNFSNIRCIGCGKKLEKGLRQRNENGIPTGNWYCDNCYRNNKPDSDRNIRKALASLPKYYNCNNTCEKCSENGIKTQLVAGNAFKERNDKNDWTGRWICRNCYQSEYQKRDRKVNHLNIDNIKKSLRNSRTGNLDPSCTTSKGRIFQKLVCELYNWKDLNEEIDNYNCPIDCIDKITGSKYQIQGRFYNSLERGWMFGNFQRDLSKSYDSMVLICISGDRNNIERIYKIQIEEIKKRKSLKITKYDSKGKLYNDGWYNNYRIVENEDLDNANNIWKKLKEFIE